MTMIMQPRTNPRIYNFIFYCCDNSTVVKLQLDLVGLRKMFMDIQIICIRETEYPCCVNVNVSHYLF